MRDFNNADHLTARYDSEARIIFALEKRGICTHGDLQHNRCTGCGTQFSCIEDAAQTTHELLEEYR